MNQLTKMLLAAIVAALAWLLFSSSRKAISIGSISSQVGATNPDNQGLVDAIAELKDSFSASFANADSIILCNSMNGYPGSFGGRAACLKTAGGLLYYL